MKKIIICELTDEQLRGIIQFDCATSPYIPIDEINDYLTSMTKEEKEWDVFVWSVVDESVERRKKEFVIIGGIKIAGSQLDEPARYYSVM